MPKEEPTKQHDRHHDYENMPAIRPINPNVRARKLHNNGVAKARQARGVEPTAITKRVKHKHPIKKVCLKSKMIALFQSNGPNADQTKESNKRKVAAAGKTQDPNEGQLMQGKTPIRHADAVIMSAYGSCSSKTGRMDIQGKCTVADGSIKTIGIVGLHRKDSFNVEEKIWKALLDNMIAATPGTLTKGEFVSLRDALLASERLANE